MRIYVSGPMSGLPKFNYPAFFAAEEIIWKAGHVPLNPARNFQGQTGITHAQYMRAAFRMLNEADAIVYLPGWSRSKGARAERVVAVQMELSIYRL